MLGAKLPKVRRVGHYLATPGQFNLATVPINPGKQNCLCKTELIKISVSMITYNICFVPWGPPLFLICLEFQRFLSAPGIR